MNFTLRKPIAVAGKICAEQDWDKPTESEMLNIKERMRGELMKRLIPCLAICTAMVGCSGDAPEANIPLPTHSSTLAVAAPTPSLTPGTEPSTASKPSTSNSAVAAETKPSPTPESEELDIDKLFAVPPAKPEVVKLPDPPPAPDVVPEVPKPQLGALPAMRLIGFSELQELKALVSINEILKVMALGDIVEDVELVELQPPMVTLKFGDTEKTIYLNQQDWIHVSTPTANNNGIGPNMPHSSKPMPAFLPPTPRPPSSLPGADRVPKKPGVPSGPNISKGFPAASPPPVPPPHK